MTCLLRALTRFGDWLLDRLYGDPPVLDPTWQRFNQALNHPDPDADTAKSSSRRTSPEG